MRWNEKRGFTLVEVIISVASLALVSVFILQMFIVSAQLSRDAADTDRAVIMAGSLMETFRAQEGPFALEGDPALTYAQRSVVNGELFFILYYDRDWQPVPGENDAVYRVSGHMRGEGGGVPPVHIDLSGEGGAVTGALMSLEVKAERFAKHGAAALKLAEMSTSRYFDRGGL